MTVICLPDEHSREWVRDLGLDVTVVVWDGDGPAPRGVENVEFMVPPYLPTAWSRDALARLPALKVIQLLTAGADPWLDVVPDEVTLCRGAGVHGSSTAQLAVAGLLMHWHRLPELARQQAEHQWRALSRESGEDKNIVILGAGDIGSKVAAALAAFGSAITLIGRTARVGVRSVDELPDIVGDHDALVVATPLTAETHGMVDAALLAKLPDGAVVVNVARGPIVVTGHLLAELQARRLRAFLDVTDPEPLPPDHPLWDAPNLILTPHVGGGAAGWFDRAGEVVRAQVLRYAQGAAVTNVIARDRS
jgi:phosphoglycerate dehydrogenase-like enzyme